MNHSNHKGNSMILEKRGKKMNFWELQIMRKVFRDFDKNYLHEEWFYNWNYWRNGSYCNSFGHCFDI